MLTEKDVPGTLDQLVALSALPAPRRCAPRTFIHLMEIADVMNVVRTGRQSTLPGDLEQIGAEIAPLCGGLGKAIALKLYRYETAL